jgi:hypothetical protein
MEDICGDFIKHGYLSNDELVRTFVK